MPCPCPFWSKSLDLQITLLMDRSTPQRQTRIKVGKLPTRSGEIAINHLLTANPNQTTSILLHIKDSVQELGKLV